MNLLILSGIPVFFLGRYIYNKDKNKESEKLLIKLFVSGILSCFLVFFITMILRKISPIINSNSDELNLIELLYFVFIGVALVEEFSKWIFLYFLTFKNEEFDESYDSIVYATFVSLGFAFFENLLYVLGGGLSVAFIRALTAVPFHACLGICMGDFLVVAKKNHIKNENYMKPLILSIIIPSLIHGIYDYGLLSQKNIFIIVSFIFLIVFFYLSIITIKKYIK